MGPPLPSPTDLPTVRCAAGRRAVADRCPRRPRPSPRAGARPDEGIFWRSGENVRFMDDSATKTTYIYITNTVNIWYVAHGHPSDNGNPNILDIKICSDDHPLWTIFTQLGRLKFGHVHGETQDFGTHVSTGKICVV